MREEKELRGKKEKELRGKKEKELILFNQIFTKNQFYLFLVPQKIFNA